MLGGTLFPRGLYFCCCWRKYFRALFPINPHSGGQHSQYLYFNRSLHIPAIYFILLHFVLIDVSNTFLHHFVVQAAHPRPRPHLCEAPQQGAIQPVFLVPSAIITSHLVSPNKGKGHVSTVSSGSCKFMNNVTFQPSSTPAAACSEQQGCNRKQIWKLCSNRKEKELERKSP